VSAARAAADREHVDDQALLRALAPAQFCARWRRSEAIDHLRALECEIASRSGNELRADAV
jgi:hypothetical protein